MRATRYIADFDSTSSMLYALGRSLDGRGFRCRRGAVAPTTGRPGEQAACQHARGAVPACGLWEAWPPHRVAEVDAEAISRWGVEQYPDRSYPGVFIGATHGGAMHLFANCAVSCDRSVGWYDARIRSASIREKSSRALTSFSSRSSFR